VQTWIRLASAAIVVMIGFVSAGWTSNAILAALAIICFAQIGIELFLNEQRSTTQVTA